MYRFVIYTLGIILFSTISPIGFAQESQLLSMQGSEDLSVLKKSLNSSAIELNYLSSTIYGESDGPEMEFYLSIQNNSDSAIDVFVIRNILDPFTPVNWFCWEVCNIPETSISSMSIPIPPESYINEFSGHIEPPGVGGVYPIEYCFFSESDYSDSVCVTATYVIDGNHPGCEDINAINYNPQANVSDFSCILYPEPNWFSSPENIMFTTEDYNTAHSFIITTDTYIEVENAPISIGDWLGVFFEKNGLIYCAGYSVWQAENTNILIYGNDSMSTEGVYNGADLFWQVWDASEGISWPMDVEYSLNFPNQNLFFQSGQSSLIYMSNMDPVTQQNIQFPENWSLFSTFIITENMDISIVFDSIADHLVIIKNNDGIAYLCEYQFNAIGDMVPGQGYLVKMNSSAELNLTGEFSKPYLFPIPLVSGWNMVGYLRQEPEYIDVIFSDLLSQDIIQIIKDSDGNAYLPAWNFDGIGLMEASKGYQVKTFDGGVLQY